MVDFMGGLQNAPHMQTRLHSVLSLLVVVVVAIALVACKAPMGSPDDGEQNAADDGGVSSACTSSAQCGGLLLCDAGKKSCVACRTTLDCGADSICEKGVCKASKPCDSDNQCRAQGKVCDTRGRRCVDCNAAADCTGNDMARLPKGTACLGFSCVERQACKSSLECPASQVCVAAPPPAWPELFAGKGCAECSTHADCPSRMECGPEGLCRKACAQEGAICGALPSGVSCGGCTSGGQCSPSGKACIETAYAGIGGASYDSAAGFLVMEEAIYLGLNASVGAAKLLRIDRKSGAHTLYPVGASKIPFGPTANASHVYYQGGGNLYRIPRGGGSEERVRTLGEGCFGDGAVDANNLYCFAQEAAPFWKGPIQVPIAGGTPIKLGSILSFDEPTALRLSGNRLYYSSRNFISSAPLGGGSETRLVNRRTDGLTIDGDQAYYGADAVYRIPLQGGPEQTVSAGTTCGVIGPIVGGALYCLEFARVGGLRRIELTSGKLTQLTAPNDPKILALAGDGEAVYLLTEKDVLMVKGK